MKSKKTKNAEHPGVCPYCGSDDVEYMGMEMGSSLKRRFICNDCNKVSHESYKLSFEKTIGEDGYDPVVNGFLE